MVFAFCTWRLLRDGLGHRRRVCPQHRCFLVVDRMYDCATHALLRFPPRSHPKNFLSRLFRLEYPHDVCPGTVHAVELYTIPHEHPGKCISLRPAFERIEDPSAKTLLESRNNDPSPKVSLMSSPAGTSRGGACCLAYPAIRARRSTPALIATSSRSTLYFLATGRVRATHTVHCMRARTRVRGGWLGLPRDSASSSSRSTASPRLRDCARGGPGAGTIRRRFRRRRCACRRIGGCTTRSCTSTRLHTRLFVRAGGGAQDLLQVLVGHGVARRRHFEYV